MPPLNEDAARQVEGEQARVSEMYGLLDKRLAQARAELADVLGSPADAPGEVYARELAAERLARQLRRLEGAEVGLVFGRVDHADGASLHIGRLGLHTDDRDDLPLLVDWRADAARPFYAATSLHPMGLRRRRHLRVERREVRAVNDELLDGTAPTAEDVVGDGPLTEALQARRTGRMGAAVATLQAEQDAIIRSPHRGVTVVRGGPGTGKTVVALHRAAYVLYAFPRAAERGVLLLGPNARFLDYVSQVLPSLGENDVVLATCVELAGVGPVAAAPAEAARRQGRAEWAEELAGWVRGRQAPGGDFAVRVGQEWVRLGEAEVAAARQAAVASGLAHNPAREVFKERLAGAVADALRRGLSEALERIDAEVTAGTGIDLDRVAEADLRALGFEGAPDAAAAAEEFDAAAARSRLREDAHVDRAVDALWPRLTPEAVVREVTAGSGPWTEADVPLLDEAASLVDGPPERTFGHVVVDEAQELTAMQWRMVLRRCPGRSMTLVGDFAQAGPAPTARDWPEALGPHFGTRFVVHTLSVSYRTTEEILATTRELLARIDPGQRPSRSIRRGEAPRALAVPAAGLAAAVAQELREQAVAHAGELLGVICADGRLAELAGLAELAELNGLAGLAAGGAVRLVPASEARGLEFDAVLVVDPEGIVAARPSGERDLYVALTRATKRLCTLTPAAP